MACYHPLKGFKIGLTDNGKPNYFITSYDTEYVQLIRGKVPVACQGKISPYINNLSDLIYEWIEIPCGRCIGCRLAYSRMWADRRMAEATMHESNYFITLTYDPEHVPMSEYVDEDGVFQLSMTLDKRDPQLFMKDSGKTMSMKINSDTFSQENMVHRQQDRIIMLYYSDLN